MLKALLAFEALSLIFFMPENPRMEPTGEGGFMIRLGAESVDRERFFMIVVWKHVLEWFCFFL